MKELVNSLRRAHSASYDSARTRKFECCFPGTRLAVLEKIKNWMTDREQPNIFWLQGLAGIGKTTIARTVAKWADDNGILGASYFFARDEVDLRDPRLVFTTLAFQMARSDENFLRSVAKAIEDDPDIAHKEIEHQFDNLIEKPLQSKSDSTTSWKIMVLVIDALDECEDHARVEAILNSIVYHITSMRSSIRVFITSRPEAHIRTVFDRDVEHQNVILHDIEDCIVQNDIFTYLSKNLFLIHSRLHLVRPEGWPSFNQLGSLVEKSGSLFIHASIVLRFICNERAANPVKRLETILSVQSGNTTSTNPYVTLDELYLNIFQNAVAEDHDEEDVMRVRNVVGAIMLLQDPLPLASFVEFLQLDKTTVMQTLRHLHSIIIVPSPEHSDEPPRFFHPSLPDFITSAERCTDDRFLVDAPREEAHLAQCCLEIMNRGLSYDLLGIGDECTHEDDVALDYMEELLEQRIAPSLRYAVKYWDKHLLKSRHSDHNSGLLAALDEFAQKHILHWIEAVSLLRANFGFGNSKFSSEVDLKRILGWAIEAGCNDKTTAMLHDIDRLISRDRRMIRDLPLQVYHSFLLFAPQDTSPYRTFVEHHSKGPLCLLSGSDTSSMTMLTLQELGIRVAYSQDGTRLAVGGAYCHGGVDICDPHMPNIYLFNLHHSGDISSVAFSPDDMHLAVACDSGVVLWDLSSRTRVRTLHSNMTEGSKEIVFSPSRRYPTLAVTGRERKAIQIWNSESGELTNTFDFVEEVNSLVFCPDGTEFLVAIGDTIKRRDVDTGQTTEIYQHTTRIEKIATSSSGERVAFIDACGTSFYINEHSTADRLPVNGDVHFVGFSDDENLIIGSSYCTNHENAEKSLDINEWNIKTDKAINLVHHDADTHVDVLLALSPDRKSVLLKYEHKFESLDFINDLRSGARTLRSRRMEHPGCLAFSDDGSLLAVGDLRSGRVDIWDTQAAVYLFTLTSELPGTEALEFSADGRWLVCACHVPNRHFQIITELAIWDMHWHKRCVRESVVGLPDGHKLSLSIDEDDPPLTIYCTPLLEPPYDPDCRWRTMCSELGWSGTFKAHKWWTWNLQKPNDEVRCYGPEAIAAKGLQTKPLLLPDDDFGKSHLGGTHRVTVEKDKHNVYWVSVGSSPSPASPSVRSKKMALNRAQGENVRAAWSGDRCAMACGEAGLLIFEVKDRSQIVMEPMHRVDACDKSWLRNNSDV
ncbi:hypothetical protein SCHPADRAFT_246730 [Schizopora paradoxa]|uniref:NACHT domain-containing protein n=1 Tax=Schizopora paradoxa TaxID=27342 RepID=A0A0H2RVR7_9AGAM|nr:hypothetical protein SCHPADRAFT_246730 [Schizopora paradoxa]